MRIGKISGKGFIRILATNSMQNWVFCRFGKVVLLTTLLGCSAVHGLANPIVRKYTISMAGINIGELIAKKEVKDSLTYYSIDSRVSVWIFFRVKVHYTITSAYHNNQLMYSRVKTETNRGNFSSSTTWAHDHYQVHVNAYKYKKDTTIQQPIRCNVARLYLDGPTAEQSVLADNYGAMVMPVKLDPMTYRFTVMDQPNRFQFKNGALHLARMYNPIKNFEIKLQE